MNMLFKEGFGRLRPLLLLAALALGLFAAAKISYAQGYFGDGWDKYLEGLRGPGEGESGEEMAADFVRNGIVIVRYLIGGVALLTGTIYALMLIFARGNEESIGKQRKNFLWALIGFLILIVAESFARLLNPERATTTALIDFNAARDQLRDIIDYIKWIIGPVMVLLMTISGVRMMTAGGDTEVIDQQKKNLAWGLVGLLVVLLASNIVNAIYVLNAPDQISAAGPAGIIEQIAGIIRLMMVVLGPIAVGFTLYAGFLYLTALDNEDQMGKAKKMIIIGITSIVIIYSAYALANTFATQDFVSPEGNGVNFEGADDLAS